MTDTATINLPSSLSADEILCNRTTDGVYDVVRVPVSKLKAQFDALEGPNYELLTELEADLDWSEDTIARVWGDPVIGNRGVYKKTGSIGTGSWTRIGALPEADLSATLRVPGTEAVPAFPDAATRALKVAAFDAEGNPYVGPTVSEISDAAQAAQDAQDAKDAALAAQAAAQGAAETVVVGRYNTQAGVEAATIDAAIETIELTGTATPADGDGWLLDRVAVEPSHDGKVQSADGAWFERKMPNVLGRRYIDVAEFCSLTDTDEAHANIQAAFNAADGRDIVFTNPLGGKRYYRCKNRSDGRLYMPLKSRIIFAPGAVLDFSDYGRTGTGTPYLYAAGTYAAKVALAANGDQGNFTITLGTGQGANWSRGDQGLLVSDAFHTTEDDALGTRGEWIFVTSVSGDVLTLAAPLRDTYLTSDNAGVFRVTEAAEISIENPQIIGAGRFTTDTLGDRGIQIINGIGCQVKGGWVRYADFNGVNLQVVRNGLIDGVEVEMEPKGATHENNQYPFVVVNSCEGTNITNCTAIGGKEGFCLSVSGEIQGVTRDTTFAFNLARGQWRSGYCSHDNHLGWTCIGNVAEDVEQGFDCRITDAYFKGNIVRRTGRFSGNLDCGFQFGSGAGKVRMEGNLVEDCLRSHWMTAGITHEQTPVDFSFLNETVRGARSYGIYMENTAGNTDALGKVAIKNFDFEGDGSASCRAVELEGKWKVIIDGLTARNNGAANRCVYLHATGNGGGANGPVNPVLRNILFDSGFTEPLIQHGSGRYYLDGIEQIGATGLPSIASASALALPTVGDMWLVTGTSPINTIPNAAAYVGREIHLHFAGSVTITHNANSGAANDIQLVGGTNFNATANDNLALRSNGVHWREVSRATI
ncbi:hypothetical protein [Roseibium aggregatum]|uniref:hypothetical protein n=1 Tax=Roseibium aggregatum TaxID=187304 RepID=UPI0025ABE2E1|nr:hypothetical protein [Roseibium aggregatum]WJS05215.1 hypothetical protein QUB73_13300 [Roseibium aggregatum]